MGDHTCQQHAMLSVKAVDGGMHGFFMACTQCFTGRYACKESSWDDCSVQLFALWRLLQSFSPCNFLKGNRTFYDSLVWPHLTCGKSRAAEPRQVRCTAACTPPHLRYAWPVGFQWKPPWVYHLMHPLPKTNECPKFLGTNFQWEIPSEPTMGFSGDIRSFSRV